MGRKYLAVLSLLAIILVFGAYYEQAQRASLEKDFKFRIISRIENDSIFEAIYLSDKIGTDEFLDGLINSSSNLSSQEEQQNFQIVSSRLRGEISFANVTFRTSEIVLFYMEGCPHCEEARQFLDSLGQKYPKLPIKEIDIDKRPENLEFAKRCSEIFAQKKFDTVPFIIVNNKTIIGWGKEDEGLLEGYIVD